MALQCGARLGRYEVVGLLGVGGMGEVYRARDDRLEREVAIKVLPEKFASNEDAIARFRRESRAVAALSHPNIRSIYDIDSDGDTTFAVMELLEGRTLADQLLLSRPAWREAVRMGVEIAEGMAAAHAKGIIHRDIKPQNIFVTQEGVAKILDFGLACVDDAGFGSSDGLTATLGVATEAGSIMGTVEYMSPEQARGQRADARSDVFSFGCVLFEMITGQRPFSRPTAADSLAALLHDESPSIADHGVTTTGDVQRIIEHCLEKSPERRFQSAGELPFALRGLLASDGTPAPYAEQTQRAGLGESGTAQESASVAVLPFVNMSSDDENEYFSDGLAEELINALSKIGGLKVASRTSAFAFKGKNQDIREIGDLLNVGTVLEGSVRKSGKRLRIRAQLVKVADGYHLWSETFDRQMEDVFEVQDEIAQSIARALRVVLTDRAKKALKKTPTDNVEAYEYYLKGRQASYQCQRRGLERARKLFTRAAELDPSYASAYAGLADVCSMLFLWFGGLEAYREEADRASRKALELDPELAEAHVSRGNALVLSKRFDEAHTEFEQAIGLDPDLFEAHYYFGRACFSEGKYEQAVLHFERAVEIRPEDYQSPGFLANAYEGLNRTADARNAYVRNIEAARKHLEFFPDDGRALYFGAIALAHLGERERGLEWVEKARDAEPEEPMVLYNVGCFYANFGDIDKAFSCLDDAVTFGIGQKQWFENDPDLNSLRDDPRFQKLLDRL